MYDKCLVINSSIQGIELENIYCTNTIFKNGKQTYLEHKNQAKIVQRYFLKK